MAKRKKTHRKTHHRRPRGRIGAVGHFNLMETMETGAGLIIGTMGASMMQKYLTALPQKVVSAGQLVLGIMNTGRPNAIVRGIAWGVASAGALGLAHETGILHGIDEMVSGFGGGGQEIEYEERVHGMLNEQTLSGMPNGTTLGATDEDGAGVADQYYAPTMGY